MRWRRWVYFLIGVVILLLGVASYCFAVLQVSAGDPVAARCGLTEVESGSPRFVDNDYWPVSITCRNPDGTTKTDVLFDWRSVAVVVALAAVFFGLFAYVGSKESVRPRSIPRPRMHAER
jgi:hypothetical protein